MPDDHEQVTALIRRWVEAVQNRDMAGVLADHADDIVMFDVPPPYDGVRGLTAYREAWPGFFQWLEEGATFELAALDVTAGGAVAFAHALMRCGTPRELAEKPWQRLRLTIGLRKQDGRWVVAHEHHSFPDTSAGEDPSLAVDR